MENNKEWAVRLLEMAPAREGYYYRCTLQHNNIPVAEFINEGRGEETRFVWKEPLEKRAFESHVASLPPYTFNEFSLTMTPGIYVEELLNDYLQEKDERSLCRQGTAFRLVGDKPDSWRLIQSPYNAAMKKTLVARHGDSIESILNEKYLPLTHGEER